MCMHASCSLLCGYNLYWSVQYRWWHFGVTSTLSGKLLHAGFLYPALPTVLHKLCSLDGGNCVVAVQGSNLLAEGGRWERDEG